MGEAYLCFTRIEHKFLLLLTVPLLTLGGTRILSPCDHSDDGVFIFNSGAAICGSGWSILNSLAIA